MKLSKDMAKVLRIISEEKAKWAESTWCVDEGKRNPFGVGVHAGIEAIEYRVKKELVDKVGE